MEETGSPFSQTSSITSKSPKKSRRFILVTFIILAIGGLIFGGKQFLDTKSEKPEILGESPTPTEYQLPTDTPTPTSQGTPTPEPTATSAPTSTPKPKPTANPLDSATGLDKSKLSVEVKNGSGEAGVGGKASDKLKGFGYNVVGTSNADNFNYTNVTIQIKSSADKYLALLKKDLGFSYTVGTTSADLSASSSADAVVIVGK